MNEKRYYWSFFDDEVIVFDKKTNQDIICLEFGSDMNNEEVFNKLALIFEELVLRLNEQQATINRLKKKNEALTPNDNFNEMRVCEVSSAYTSQTCHICGSINSALACDDREWTCTNCQSVHDRDVNAAINILNRWDNGDLPFDR